MQPKLGEEDVEQSEPIPSALNNFYCRLISYHINIRSPLEAMEIVTLNKLACVPRINPKDVRMLPLIVWRGFGMSKSTHLMAQNPRQPWSMTQADALSKGTRCLVVMFRCH